MKPQEAARIIEKRQVRDRAIAAAYEGMANDPEAQSGSARNRVKALEAEIEKLRADIVLAWDRGYDCGQNDAHENISGMSNGAPFVCTLNPYRGQS